jgi:glycosyltransferase involved in cell wall biosynthesis
MASKLGNVVVFSSCPEIWGGSEELWSQSVELLAKKGYKVHVFKLSIDFQHPQVKKLIALGCKFTDLNEYLPSIVRRIWNRFLPFNTHRTLPFYIKRVLAQQVRRLRPELFIISQGANFDGLPYVRFCDMDGIPYVIISQKAIPYLYPNDWARKELKELWRGSRMNYFVSHDNLEITQNQFGMKFDRAEVVRNPYLTKLEKPLNWDFSSNGTIKLACVGRFYILDKGQDILLNVLAREKWRKHDIELSFYGKGVNEDGIRDLAAYHGLDNVRFRGHVSDVESIWREHHALVLPARNEGLPLVLVEAMMCGRVPIITNVGGVSEVLEDNVSGFIASSADEDSFDEALERAWQKRNEWQQIASRGSETIRQHVVGDPAAIFAEKLEAIIDSEKEGERGQG